MSSTGNIEEIPLTDERWQAFVAEHPSATPFHHPSWALSIARCYSFPAHVLVLRQGAEIRAGLPVLRAPRLLSRSRRWVALPFTDQIEPLLDGVDLEVFAAALERWRVDRAVGRLDVHGRLGDGFAVATDAVVHRLVLDRDAVEVERGFSAATRRNIRKAERDGVTVTLGSSERDLVETYFGLHVATRRRLGVPTQPRRFFRELWRNVLLPGRGSLLLAEHDGRTIAGAVFLDGDGYVIYKYGASDASAWALRPNNVLFSTAIRRSCERGAQVLDFGRSDLEDEGLRRFKSGWGAVEEPLPSSVMCDVPVDTPRRSGQALAPMLRRSPAWVTRAVGAALYRYAA